MLCTGALNTSQALAGGLWTYEVGTDDVGLASAGYGARAQDASTVLTNPAGMTRLDGTQVMVGAQALYGDLSLSMNPVRAGFSAGGDNGGNPIGWFPGGSFFISYSVSPDLKFGFGTAGNFGGSVHYDDTWAGRYYAKESTLLGASLLPSIAYRINENLSLGLSANAMYGYLKNTIAINNIGTASDGQLRLRDTKWGWGFNLGLLYEASPATRLGLVYNSQINLDFSPQAQFSNLTGPIAAKLTAAGLLNGTVNMGIKVPQGVMGSVFHQMNDRWAVLGSVGWQQWSKFGQIDIGVESSAAAISSVTTQLNFKDTWHGAAGAQYRPSEPWLVNFGIAYDSKFQDGSNISPSLPTNTAWRFGIGGKKQESKSFSWGVAAEYVYGGSTSINKTSVAPIVAGGRGDLSGSFSNINVYYLSANGNWKF